MPHIKLPTGAPGIRGLLSAFPGTGQRLSQLAEALLRGPSSLTPAERELIAAYVSGRNDCFFCTSSHAAAARALLGATDAATVDAVIQDPETAPVSAKLRALLAIAEHVRGAVKPVPDAAVERARRAGADDQAVHDAVLIAAAFCMFNRYVEGLGTTAPRERTVYDEMGVVLATQGYVRER